MSDKKKLNDTNLEKVTGGFGLHNPDLSSIQPNQVFETSAQGGSLNMFYRIYFKIISVNSGVLGYLRDCDEITFTRYFETIQIGSCSFTKETFTCKIEEFKNNYLNQGQIWESSLPLYMED